MPKLTSDNLNDLGFRLGFLKDKKGLCHGFSCTLLLALWDGYLSDFIKILNLINQHQEYFDLLIEKIEEIQEKVKVGEVLSSSENHLLRISAFYAEITLFQEPSFYKEFFNVSLKQTDFLEIYSLISSPNNPSSSPDMLLDVSRAFNKKSLFSFLNKLQLILSSDTPALLGSDDHSVLLGIDEETGLWLYCDINKLTKKSPYYILCSTQKLVDLIFSSFNDNPVSKWGTIGNQFQNWLHLPWGSSSCTVFNIKIPSKSHNSLLKKQLQKLASQFPVDENQLGMRNARQVNLFWLLVADGNLSTIKELLHYYPHLNVNNENSLRETSLHIAVRSGREETVDFLLQHPSINVNQSTNYGYTPIFIAVKEGELGCITLLLQHRDIDINYTDNTGNTPLTRAIMSGNLPIVQALLGHSKLDINKRNRSSKSPLFIAVELNQLAIVHALLQKGAETQGNFFCSVQGLQKSLLKFSPAASERGKKFIGSATTRVLISPLKIAELLGYDEIVVLLQIRQSDPKLGEYLFPLLQSLQELPDFQKKNILTEIKWLIQQNASSYLNDEHVIGIINHFIEQSSSILEKRFPEVQYLILLFANATLVEYFSWFFSVNTLNADEMCFITQLITFALTNSDSEVPIYKKQLSNNEYGRFFSPVETSDSSSKKNNLINEFNPLDEVTGEVSALVSHEHSI